MTFHTLHALKKTLDGETTMSVSFSESGGVIEVARYHNSDLIGTRDLSRLAARKLYRALRAAGYVPSGPVVRR